MRAVCQVDRRQGSSDSVKSWFKRSENSENSGKFRVLRGIVTLEISTM